MENIVNEDVIKSNIETHSTNSNAMKNVEATVHKCKLCLQNSTSSLKTPSKIAYSPTVKCYNLLHDM